MNPVFWFLSGGCIGSIYWIYREYDLAEPTNEIVENQRSALDEVIISLYKLVRHDIWNTNNWDSTVFMSLLFCTLVFIFIGYNFR